MFKEIYKKYIITDNFNEEKIYYARHAYRYRRIMDIYARLSFYFRQKGICDVLDVGGGQFALLTRKLYGDRSVAVDIGNPTVKQCAQRFKYLEDNGVKTMYVDMCHDNVGCEKFDFIFFSEVLEHLPVPAYTVFRRLRAALRPGGIIICCVPNLTSLENIFSFIFNLPVFSFFKGPTGTDAGHVIMYTKEHLRWQIERAGFKDIDIRYEILLKYHRSVLRNILFCLGFPLFAIPHFRTEIIAIIKKEE